MIKKQKILNILAILFFVFVFLNDTTVYNVYFDSISTFFIIISCVILTIFVLTARKIYVNMNFWFFILFWLFTVIISCVLAGINNFFWVRVSYWLITIIMVTTMFISNVDLKRTIYNVSKVFCIWCLVCYFYTILECNFLPITHTADTLAYDWYTINLHGFFISNPISHIYLGPLQLLRLDRPFGEPGIAQIFMNYGLIYYIFFITNNEKKERKWFYIFAIASVLTFSLIGYIILLSILIFKLYKEKKYKTLFLFLIISFIVASVMIIQKMSTFSYSDRTEDYGFMINTIINNIPFGIGIGNTGRLERTSDSRGFYCGLLYPLMQYGFLGLVYYWALYKSIIYSYLEKNKNIFRATFGVFIIFTLLTEPQADEPLILCFIFDGLLRYFSQNKRENN